MDGAREKRTVCEKTLLAYFESLWTHVSDVELQSTRERQNNEFCDFLAHRNEMYSLAYPPPPVICVCVEYMNERGRACASRSGNSAGSDIKHVFGTR